MKNTALLTVLLMAAGNLTAASPMNPMQGFYQKAKEAYNEWRTNCEEIRLVEGNQKLYRNLDEAIIAGDKKKVFEILDATERHPHGIGSPYWSNLRFTPIDIFWLVDHANNVNPELAKELLAYNDNALAASLMGRAQETETLIYERSNLAPKTTKLLAQELAARNFAFSQSLAKKAHEGEDFSHEILGTRPFTYETHFKPDASVAEIIQQYAAPYDHSDQTSLVNPQHAKKIRLVE